MSNRFNDCTVTSGNYKGKEVVIIQFANGELAGALTKKPTFDETMHDFLYVMRDNGYSEDDIAVAVKKVKETISFQS